MTGSPKASVLCVCVCVFDILTIFCMFTHTLYYITNLSLSLKETLFQTINKAFNSSIGGGNFVTSLQMENLSLSSWFSSTAVRKLDYRVSNV